MLRSSVSEYWNRDPVYLVDLVEVRHLAFVLSRRFDIFRVFRIHFSRLHGHDVGRIVKTYCNSGIRVQRLYCGQHKRSLAWELGIVTSTNIVPRTPLSSIEHLLNNNAHFSIGHFLSSAGILYNSTQDRVLSPEPTQRHCSGMLSGSSVPR